MWIARSEYFCENNRKRKIGIISRQFYCRKHVHQVKIKPVVMLTLQQTGMLIEPTCLAKSWIILCSETYQKKEAVININS